MSDTIPTDLITVKQACRLIPGREPDQPIHVATFYRWILSGRIKAWRLRQRWLVSRADVLALFEPVAARPEVETAAARRRRQREASEGLRRAGWG